MNTDELTPLQPIKKPSWDELQKLKKQFPEVTKHHEEINHIIFSVLMDYRKGYTFDFEIKDL
jgi:hypothetical protein